MLRSQHTQPLPLTLELGRRLADEGGVVDEAVLGSLVLGLERAAGEKRGGQGEEGMVREGGEGEGAAQGDIEPLLDSRYVGKCASVPAQPPTGPMD